MKRTIAISLLAALCASQLGCGEAGAPSETTAPSTETTTSAETTTVSDEPDLPDVDMNGFKFRVANVASNVFSWAEVSLTVEEMNGDSLNDAIYNRNADLMSRFNFEFEETILDSFEPEYLSQMVLAGEDLYDLCLIYDIRLPNVISYAGSWSEIPHIQLDKPWWNPDATEVFNIDGEYYAVAGDYTLCYQSRAMCYLFNKDIYAELGVKDNIYDLVREYKWTNDKFIELAKTAKRDLNGDSEFTEVDQYGVFGNPRAYLNTMLGGTGAPFISKNEDGKFVFDMATNQTVIDLLEKFVRYSAQELDYNTGTQVHELLPDTLFKNGQALFNVGGMPFAVTSLRDMDDDFGIVPLPMADESQGRYYSVSYGGLLGCLPKTVAPERYENIGIIMEALSYETYKEILPLYMEQTVKVKGSRDEDSLEMLDIVFNTITFDPGILIWCSKISDDICKNIFMPADENIVSFLTEQTSVYQNEIDSFNEAIG